MWSLRGEARGRKMFRMTPLNIAFTIVITLSTGLPVLAPSLPASAGPWLHGAAAILGLAALVLGNVSKSVLEKKAP